MKDLQEEFDPEFQLNKKRANALVAHVSTNVYIYILHIHTIANCEAMYVCIYRVGQSNQKKKVVANRKEKKHPNKMKVKTTRCEHKV